MIYSWQKKQWDKIVACYQQRRMPHALLLAGNRGLGKLTFAKSLAELVLCERNPTQACGICRGCQLFRVGNHPDFFEVSLEKKSKAIKVAQIRDLIAALNQTSQQGRYQVVILFPAEAMNRAAANAFLKTLEEPSGQVLLILVTHQLGALPPTIISRCQRILFRAYSDLTTLQWVEERVNGNKDKARQLLVLANHAPLQAIELESLNYLSLRDRLLKLLINTVTQRVSVVSIVSILLKEDIKLILYIIITFLMDVLRLQLNCHYFILNADHISLLQELSSILSREKLLVILQQLQETWRVITGSAAVNSQLLLEEIFLMLEIRSVS